MYGSKREEGSVGTVSSGKAEELGWLWILWIYEDIDLQVRDEDEDEWV